MVQAKLDGYDAALTESVFFINRNSGCIQLSGPDRVDFLQRQTTNDVRMLTETRAVRTVLTSPTARILDVLWLIRDGDSIRILTLPGRGSFTVGFLGSKIFFMDKVTVEDQSAQIAQIELDGPTLRETLGNLGLTLPEVDAVVAAELDGIPIKLIGKRGLGRVGARLLVEGEYSDRIVDVLRSAGATELSLEAQQTLRVEAGLPGEREMSEEYTPLEVHLEEAISDTKGCYTGQEIIARQITFEKVTRSLVGIRLDGPVEQGATVLAEKRNIGSVTSVVESPRFGWIALAVLKRPHNEAGAQVVIEMGGSTVNGLVGALPFA